MIDIKKVRMLSSYCPSLRMNESELKEHIKEYEISDNLLPDIEIDGIVLKNGCIGCPEQYEAFKDGKQIGYLRLRWGVFTVDYCTEDDVHNLIMKVTYKNQPYKGRFTDEERLEKLTQAVQVLKEYHEMLISEGKII